MNIDFLDMVLQHLHPWMPQPAECPSKLGVIGIIIGEVLCSCGARSFSWARTSVFPRVLFFFKLTQGIGTCGSSSGLGARIFFSVFTFKSGVYSVTRNVSYLHGSFAF